MASEGREQRQRRGWYCTVCDERMTDESADKGEKTLSEKHRVVGCFKCKKRRIFVYHA
jgi:hypothetical protein